MTWLRVDDGMVDHPKIETLSDAAFRVHMRALSYCARWSTDGVVPAEKVARWGKAKVFNECVAAGVWHVDGALYVIHDFLDYNPSKADLAKKSDAGKIGAANRWGSPNGIAPAIDSAMAPTRDPVPTRPSPDPDPSQPSSARAREPVPPASDFDPLTRCVRAFDDLMGNLAGTPQVQRQIREWLESAPPGYDGVQWFEDACGEAALNEGKSLKYVLAILKRWQREGREDRRPSPNGASSGDPDRAAYLAAKSRGTNSGAGLVVFTSSDEAIIQRYESKQREAQHA